MLNGTEANKERIVCHPMDLFAP